jgi:hypothetical protein
VSAVALVVDDRGGAAAGDGASGADEPLADELEEGEATSASPGPEGNGATPE